MISVTVFPAHAGMNRLEQLRDQLLVGVPRARGDEPPSDGLTYEQLKCSPRTRG